MRPPIALLALLLLLLGAPVPPADARGGAGAVQQHLLEKGAQALRLAERAYFARDLARASRHGLEAERLFRDVLVQAPTHKQAALLAAQAAVFAGELPRAKQWVVKYSEISRAKEGDPDLHYLRAFVHLLGDKRPARALRSLQRMYGLNPRQRPAARDTLWTLALSDLGRRYLEAGKTEEAARQFATGARVARRMGDRRKELLMLGDLGTAYMRAERYIEATEIYEGLAKIEPTSLIWHWRLGLSLANQNRFKDAVATYRKVQKLQKDGARLPRGHETELRDLPLRLGNCLRHLAGVEHAEKQRIKLLEDAETWIRAFMKANPRDARGPKWLGVLFQEDREQPYEGLKHLAASFALDPMCEGVLRRMIQIHARHPAPKGSDAGDWKKKLAAMEKDLQDGAERRKKEIERRKTETGSTGCS